MTVRSNCLLCVTTLAVQFDLMRNLLDVRKHSIDWEPENKDPTLSQRSISVSMLYLALCVRRVIDLYDDPFRRTPKIRNPAEQWRAPPKLYAKLLGP